MTYPNTDPVEGQRPTKAEAWARSAQAARAAAEAATSYTRRLSSTQPFFLVRDGQAAFVISEAGCLRPVDMCEVEPQQIPDLIRWLEEWFVRR